MLKKNVVNNVDMSSLGGTMTKWPVHKTTRRPTLKHVEHQDVVLTFITLTCFRNTSVLTVR